MNTEQWVKKAEVQALEELILDLRVEIEQKTVLLAAYQKMIAEAEQTTMPVSAIEGVA